MHPRTRAQRNTKHSALERLLSCLILCLIGVLVSLLNKAVASANVYQLCVDGDAEIEALARQIYKTVTRKGKPLFPLITTIVPFEMWAMVTDLLFISPLLLFAFIRMNRCILSNLHFGESLCLPLCSCHGYRPCAQGWRSC